LKLASGAENPGHDVTLLLFVWRQYCCRLLVVQAGPTRYACQAIAGLPFAHTHRAAAWILFHVSNAMFQWWLLLLLLLLDWCMQCCCYGVIQATMS